MFKIIGADQKEYGPISVEQIRRWVSDGRLNAQSQAQREGSSDWQPLSTFEEFAEIFRPETPIAPVATPFLVPVAAIATGTDEMAVAAIKGPALALMITAGLGVAFYLLVALLHFIGAGNQGFMPPNTSPELRSIIEHTRGPAGGFIALFVAAVNGFVFFGAQKMMKLQSFNLAIATCIVAMLPCQCCCIFGLPFGIWALVMLNKPEVKSQFLN